MERTLSKLITYPVNGNIADALPSTIAGQDTARLRRAVARVSDVDLFLPFQSARACAGGLGHTGRDARAGGGHRIGRDVSPAGGGEPERMHDRVGSLAEHGRPTQRIVRRKFPNSRTQCEAVDARYMPFRDESFDAVMCCYLLELLSGDDIVVALQEIYRVLRRRGTFTLVLIGQNTEFFNQAYRVCGSLAPAFWGRQVEQRIPELIESLDFRITGDKALRQGFYPSRILTARR